MQFLNIGPGEMILILVIALVVFGPGKLPEIGRSVGRGINEFRRATTDLTREFSQSIDDVKQPFDDLKGAVTGTAKTPAAIATVYCPNCSASIRRPTNSARSAAAAWFRRGHRPLQRLRGREPGFQQVLQGVRRRHCLT